ncbi:uncharacterized protein LOC123677009 [Harmonia axyridis]|uniref:uncharacterized protein LOC123677009 n=1 Tax=Harmonia axyridis TaxID=115357 RepID=UPI001E275431|nr:uncharacterized protein LOC123677009 [Harmonia axyridis]
MEQEDASETPKSILKSMKILPVMFLYVISSMMSTLTTENLNLEKACLVNIGFNESICQAMVVRNSSAYTADQEIKVHKLVTSLLVYKTAIQGLIPFSLMLFLGSWSDTYKRRRPFIIIPICGDIVSSLGFIICTFFFLELPVEVAIFFEAVPVAVAGYWFCFFVGVYSYVTETSSEETRTMRIGLATVSIHVSITSGIALSGIFYRTLGFYGVYSLSVIMYVIALVYVHFVIQDQSLISEELPRKKLLKDIFDHRHVSRTLSLCLKKKEHNRRLKLILVMVLVVLNVGCYRGELTVMYMFTRRKFTWNEIDFSIYNTYHFTTHMLGALFCLMVFIKWMKIDDTTLGMLAMMSKVVGSFSSAFAPTPLFFYLAALTEVFNGSSHIAMRSIMSKLVTPNELGQTFSLFGLCEAFTPLLCGPLYSYVYHQTIENFPGAFYFVSVCLHTGAFLIFLWLFLLRRDVVQNETMKEHENIEMLEKTRRDSLNNEC